jgi:hypothetical protein
VGVAAGALACSPSHSNGGDAAIDAPMRGARDHDYDLDYGEAGPPAPLGDSLQGAVLRWTWIDFPDSRCRDGSSTGLAVNLNPASSNVMVFLDQGGACFNQLTCELNASSYRAATFGAGQNLGIFNRVDPDNPVRDWSFVFIPYCSGDVHSGSQPNGVIPGVGAQQFLGYRNLDLFFSRIVPTFPDAKQVLVAGSSAGGFGVLLNADRMARWFAPIPVTILSDSGPPMPASVVEPCLQQTWRDLWGFDQGVLPDCGGDCPYTNDYMLDQVLHFGWRYPSYRGGIISSTRDLTIDLFFSFGWNNCTAGTIPPAAFEAGLGDVRSQLQQMGSPFGTYYLPDTHHIWLMDDASYAASVNGVSLKGWLADLLGGTVRHVGP